MTCSVCSSAPVVSAGLCSNCSALTVKVAEVPTAPMQWKGTHRSNVRDRQWLFRHASEALANPDVTIPDLESIRDRMPNSRKGQAMRRRINTRIEEIRNPPTFGDLHRL
jgi:hypothetical protein